MFLNDPRVMRRSKRVNADAPPAIADQLQRVGLFGAVARGFDDDIGRAAIGQAHQVHTGVGGGGGGAGQGLGGEGRFLGRRSAGLDGAAVHVLHAKVACRRAFADGVAELAAKVDQGRLAALGQAGELRPRRHAGARTSTPRPPGRRARPR